MPQQYLPDEVVDRRYYRPSLHGEERRIAERLAELEQTVAENTAPPGADETAPPGAENTAPPGAENTASPGVGETGNDGSAEA